MEGMTSIGGDLVLECLGATSLRGLDNLAAIGGNAYIGVDDQLTSLAGLDGLLSVSGDLGISLDPLLESLAGLEGLRELGTVPYTSWSDPTGDFGDLSI